MFRGVLLHPEEKDFHRFLVRTKEGALEDWRMCRLTFGVKSSPFLATQTLQQAASLLSSKFPLASKAILDSFYVDDCLTGASTLQEAQDIQQQLCALFSEIGMLIRKWRSNSPEFIKDTPEELRDSSTQDLVITEDPADHGKALGIHWNTQADSFHIVTPAIEAGVPTKRAVASAAARVYNLMGWYGPVLLTVKILMQKLWVAGIGWDDPISAEHLLEWKAWSSNLPQLTTHPIPRRYDNSESSQLNTSLHVFADASSKGYGAVVYVRIVYQDTSISTAIVSSRTRVAPSRSKLTIPKLELAAALLAAQLLQIAGKDLNISPDNWFAWTDSSVVLGWLANSKLKWRVFVSHRVTQICGILPHTRWRHVPTNENPADHASRGLLPEEILRCKLWWSGPLWLAMSPEHWPTPLTIPRTLTLPESVVAINVVSTVNYTLPPPLERFSTLQNALRTLAWCRRFANNCKHKERANRTLHHTLLPAEISATSVLLAKLSQQESFPDAYVALQLGKSVSKPANLAALKLFIASDGLIRIGGRLGHSMLPSEQRHPVLLHHQSRYSRLLVQDIHANALHAGPSTMMAIMAEHYHILGARRIVKSLSQQCIRCQKAYCKTSAQMMGQLPADRTRPSPPFHVTGIDFAGPFLTRRGNPRKPVKIKSYACLFVCFSTRSIHLELCSEMTTSCMMAALTRFVARRGLPAKIQTDNGSNFLGASRELAQCYNLLASSEFQDAASRLHSSQRVEWHFSPARAPHFGGLWESGVRAMKSILKKVLPPHLLTFEELNTLLTDVEATLNSRPMVVTNSPPQDGDSVLTPGHFLVGRPLKSLPISTDPDVTVSLQRRWKLIRQLSQDIWRIWRTSYSKSLNAHTRWKEARPNLRVNDIVLIKDETLLNRTWPLARVTRVFTGQDGLVRVVEVFTNGTTYRRPVNRIVRLFNAADDSRHLSPREYVQASET